MRGFIIEFVGWEILIRLFIMLEIYAVNADGVLYGDPFVSFVTKKYLFKFGRGKASVGCLGIWNIYFHERNSD